MTTTTTNNVPTAATPTTSSSSNSTSAPPMVSSAAAAALSSSDKLLQFNRATKIYLVPGIDELTDEEYNNLWPTEEDNQRLQQHLAETLQALRLNNGEVPCHLKGQITSRGLESLLATINSDPNSPNHPKTLKDHHTRTVLDCQDQTSCPEAVAGASRSASQAARNRALDLANALERELRIDEDEEGGE